MTAAPTLESQEETAWDAYLAHSGKCTDCATFHAYCGMATRLLKTVRELRDEIGWGPRSLR
ncbi:hypothetical protein GCM10011583_31650 [Streptomyces camponoticapitis]|uniref:Uncharacterized protein n=1 Tax=Streptomyces camponoticapitis TaxID=1616125 RepID=A0ABQ2E6P5_9ACTN|nr:hypothetical protein [Streptomyces camponoticapitis]GGJ97847.1 hypothetical protein GCM10011583_31650 [Streptomyces camponoticapitis]